MPSMLAGIAGARCLIRRPVDGRTLAIHIYQDAIAAACTGTDAFLFCCIPVDAWDAVATFARLPERTTFQPDVFYAVASYGCRIALCTCVLGSPPVEEANDNGMTRHGISR